MNKSKLFNETQSEHFLTLCSVINDIHRGSLLTETDILHRFPHIDWADKDRLLWLPDILQGYRRSGKNQTV